MRTRGGKILSMWQEISDFLIEKALFFKYATIICVGIKPILFQHFFFRSINAPEWLTIIFPMVEMTWSPLHFFSLSEWYDPFRPDYLSSPVVTVKSTS